MAFSKHHFYNPTDQIIGGYAHAFSHAARILIIKQLLTMGKSAVQVLAQDHPIHKESLSGHLKILRHFELVEWEERYPYTFYAVHDENLKKAITYLSNFLEILKSAGQTKNL